MMKMPGRYLFSAMARVRRGKSANAVFAESVEDFVRRRHAELHRRQHKNDEIWPMLAAELAQRRFVAPGLSERQLRRIVYG